MHRLNYGVLLLLSLSIGCGGNETETDGSPNPTPPSQSCTKDDALGGFESRVANVDGEQVHFMTGGSGPALVLLHGWPAAWISWKKIMPALAGHFTVIAPDLRGLGDSSVPSDFQLDTPKAAENIYQLVTQLGYKQIFLVGHDWGGSVAYSYALAHREQVAKLAIMESAPVQDFSELERAAPETFWFNWFYQVTELPEELVAGKERVYLSWFYKKFRAPPRRHRP